MAIFDLSGYDYVVGWGTGSYADAVISKNYGQLKYDFFVDSKVLGKPGNFHRLDVFNPEKLHSFSGSEKNVLVVVLSSFFDEILDDLDSNYEGIDYVPASIFEEVGCKDGFDVLGDVFSSRRVVLTVSRNNFNSYVGGTSKLIREQVDTLEVHGFHPVHLYWRVAKLNGEKSFLYFLVFKGKVALIEEDYLLLMLTRVHRVVVHNCIDMSFEVLSRILDRSAKRVFFYLHDYSYMCRSITLIKPDFGFCSSFESEWSACAGCPFEASSVRARSYLSSLIEKYNPLFIAPSLSVRNNYIKAFPEMSVEIVPHWSFLSEHRCDVISPVKNIAFVGRQVDSKGWDLYKKIVALYGDVYHFYYLGIDEETVEGCDSIYVNEKDGGESSVIRALVEHKIDVVTVLSPCPETYSFVLFEAYQAGCWVVTMAVSGNAADHVKRNASGIVFNDEQDLVENFSCRLGDINRFPRYIPILPTVNPKILDLIEHG